MIANRSCERTKRACTRPLFLSWHYRRLSLRYLSDGSTKTIVKLINQSDQNIWFRFSADASRIFHSKLRLVVTWSSQSLGVYAVLDGPTAWLTTPTCSVSLGCCGLGASFQAVDRSEQWSSALSQQLGNDTLETLTALHFLWRQIQSSGTQYNQATWRSSAKLPSRLYNGLLALETIWEYHFIFSDASALLLAIMTWGPCF